MASWGAEVLVIKTGVAFGEFPSHCLLSSSSQTGLLYMVITGERGRGREKERER
jgi:hypothetical protein